MKKYAAGSILLLLALVTALNAFGEEKLTGYSEETGWQYVAFGRMPQENTEQKTEIRWRVLDADEHQALLISDQILAAGQIDSAADDFPGWESSELYAWLNGSFLSDVFSADEAAALLSQEDLSLVSLPSRQALEEYLPQKADRTAAATESAMRKGLPVHSLTGSAPYWTRSEGSSFENAVYRVMNDGTWGELHCSADNMGIRPVILIDLEQVSVASGAGKAEAPFVLSLPSASVRAARISPTPRPTRTPAPTETPAEEPTPQPVVPQEEGPRFFPTEYAALFPELTEEGFLPDGNSAFSYQDAEQGLWLYADQDLRIEIVRREDTTKKKKPKRWLEADIFIRKGAARQSLTNYFHGETADSGILADESEIARENGLVFAVNGDWYYYRVQRNAKKRTMTVGVILRQGTILYDDPGQKDVTTLPTRDLLALYADGRMEAYEYNEASGQQLLEKGVYETLCFGPILIRDGAVTSKTKKISARQAENPRCGVGQAEPGHFVAIVVEGGTKQSVGMKLEDFANLFAQRGCQTAFNLNGGGAANMMFLGEYITENKAAAQNRQQNEVLGIGILDQAQ